MIKFFDIYRQDKIFHPIIINKIKRLFKKGDYILGNEVKKFEDNFKKYCGSKYAISCGNGTDALTLALKSLNLSKKSEVIIPAMTYCSTAFAVINAGLKPILVDLEKNKPTISVEQIKKKININTKVIMPVHLYGSVADLTSIKKIIKKKKIYIIDDCAQAHGAYDDSNNHTKVKIGAAADISCFSLYPGKNLGAYGDAGIITTNNIKIDKRLKKLRSLGSEKKFIHEYVGQNSRLDTIQAIILNEKIKYLDRNNHKRILIAAKYKKKINNVKIQKLEYSKSCVYHQYVILVKDRHKFMEFMSKNGIQTGIHYPESINKLKCFQNFFKKQKYLNSELIARHCVSLPIDPNLSKKSLGKIINIINRY